MSLTKKKAARLRRRASARGGIWVPTHVYEWLSIVLPKPSYGCRIIAVDQETKTVTISRDD